MKKSTVIIIVEAVIIVVWEFLLSVNITNWPLTGRLTVEPPGGSVQMKKLPADENARYAAMRRKRQRGGSLKRADAATGGSGKVLAGSGAAG